MELIKLFLIFEISKQRSWRGAEEEGESMLGTIERDDSTNLIYMNEFFKWSASETIYWIWFSVMKTYTVVSV